MTGIYCIENIENHKQYVGLAKDIAARWHSHKSKLRQGTHPNKHLQAAWNMYGEDAFSFFVLEETAVDELREAEMRWIKQLDTFHNGYNMTAGGDGQHERYLTEEEKQHLSEINMGEKNPNYGLKRSEETRRKMSEAMKGRKHGKMSEAHRAAISKGNKGKPRPWNNKPVIWIETGEVFINISEAANATGFSISGISCVCRGDREKIYKQHFKFVEDNHEQN